VRTEKGLQADHSEWMHVIAEFKDDEEAEKVFEEFKEALLDERQHLQEALPEETYLGRFDNRIELKLYADGLFDIPNWFWDHGAENVEVGEILDFSGLECLLDIAEEKEGA